MNFFIGFVFWWQVVDGDTIRAHLLTWPNHAAMEETIRLVRIDAPETRGVPDCEKELAAKATNWTTTRLTNANGKRVIVKVDLDNPPKRDSFGRVLGDVIVDGVSLSDAGLAAGVFRPYSTVRPKVPWC